jgi:hypothetical protein
LRNTQTYTQALDVGVLLFGHHNQVNTDAQLGMQFDGKLYDLQFYNNKLTSDNISTLNATPGSVIPEPATVGLFVISAVTILGVRRTLFM